MPRFDIITVFPGFFGSAGIDDSTPAGILGHGILRRALVSGLVQVHVHNLRDHAHDKHHTVDDRPFGGGEGMVLKPEPLAEAVEALGIPPKSLTADLTPGPQPDPVPDPVPLRDPTRETVILLSAAGRPFTQPLAHQLAQLDRIVLICGRYEGIDERVATGIADREVSIGDYVLSGGELAAAILVDAVTRLVPGVLGNAASSQFESFGPADSLLVSENPPSSDTKTPPSATHGAGGLLDYPHYTRPAEFRGLRVPDILTNGNHDQVRRWRREQALAKTWRTRPDLLRQAEAAGLLDESDRAFLAQLD